LIKTVENYLRLENNENCFGLENNVIHLRVANFDTMIHYSIHKFKLYGDIAAWEDPHDESGDIIYATCLCLTGEYRGNENDSVPRFKYGFFSIEYFQRRSILRSLILDTSSNDASSTQQGPPTSIASHIFVSYHPLSLITAIMSYENCNEYLVRTGSAENHNGAREAMTDELVIPIPTPRSETTSFIPTDTTLPSQIDIITQLTPYDVVSMTL
jgi:hypothetical protein